VRSTATRDSVIREHTRGVRLPLRSTIRGKPVAIIRACGRSAAYLSSSFA
jgi:hypothetical protein